ncbi:MAG TPA: TadE family protein [Pyrinomonadaceae bacterium]|nr:TadE family protein [Pyrinomonadaceae bacterium]
MRVVGHFRSRLTRFALRDERGTQLVELAIVIPVAVLLLASVAEFGRFFYTYTTLSKATRAGARYLVSQPPGTKDAAGQNLVVYGSTAGGTKPVVDKLGATQVKVVYSAAEKTTTVRIENYKYEPIFDLGRLTNNPKLSLAVNVGASTTMHQLVD